MTELPLGIYRHYKGHPYEVLGVALHSETHEEFVVYRALYAIEGLGEGALFVRLKTQFEEEVEVDGKKMKRFSFVGVI